MFQKTRRKPKNENSIGTKFRNMSHDNRNVSSIGKSLNFVTNKRLCPITSQQTSSTKMLIKNKRRGKWTNSSTAKYQHTINIPVQDEIIKMKEVDSKEYTESIDNKSYEDIIDDDPITVLRKEIQDWRINELLTSRTEERLTGTPSEQRSYNYSTL